MYKRWVNGKGVTRYIKTRRKVDERSEYVLRRYSPSSTNCEGNEKAPLSFCKDCRLYTRCVGGSGNSHGGEEALSGSTRVQLPKHYKDARVIWI